jgi:hypothetical protein
MVDWSRPLTRTLVLKSGVRLKTVHDVAEAFFRRFGNVNHDEAIAHAIELTMRAPIRERELTARPRRTRWR